MTLHFFGSLAKLFGGRKIASATYRSALLTYAKTEYGDDWQYAYDHMIKNNGYGPSYRHIQGID